MAMKYAYLDLDTVAYQGAAACEKANYVWVSKVDGARTSKFTNAADAATYMEDAEFTGLIDPADWEREKIIDEKPVEEAYKATVSIMKNWIKTVKDLFGEDVKLTGYLSSKGEKNKVIPTTIKVYQHNRIGKPKPRYLEECRQHMLKTFSWIKLSPKGVEADACVVNFAEKHGENGVAAFIDKDLKQVMGCYYIDMNDAPKERELVLSTELGYIDLKEGMSTPTGIGDGFKLICFQTCAGDSSDGYGGLMGVGAVKAKKLFEDCESIKECCEVLLNTYRHKYPDGIKYTSWSGIDMALTADELVDQHMRLAYHERGGKDVLTPIRRYLNGDNPIYQHKRRI